MNQEDQIFFQQLVTKRRGIPQICHPCGGLLDNIGAAVGDNPSWKIAPYRTGVKNYVAVDIEGSLGTLNLNIGIYGEVLIPSAEEILRAREAVILVSDTFDVFHLVHIIHCRLTGLAATDVLRGTSFLRFSTNDVQVA